MPTTSYRDYLIKAEPPAFDVAALPAGQTVLNMGPQHPSTHGVLRLELVTDGEVVLDVMPHIGYLHRCFEKHAESMAPNQTIPYVDRMDYLGSMNSEHVWAMAVERLLGIEELPPRVEYIRVLVAELNRIASHFLAIGTYGLDVGAFTPFLWLMRDREYIQRLFEWLCGSRLLYNYIWVGGLYYDLPSGFEERCREFLAYLTPKLDEMDQILVDNPIFVERTANVGVLPPAVAIGWGCSGPMLRGSGLPVDLRRTAGYSVYSALDFAVPVGEGRMGTVGDCWDRTWVRARECRESLGIISQCLEQLETGAARRSREFNPQAACPKKIRPKAQELYFRGETPRGELGYFFRTTGTGEIPFRVKARAPSFSNLSVLPHISRGCLVADLVAIIGSVDIVLGEVDR